MKLKKTLIISLALWLLSIVAFLVESYLFGKGHPVGYVYTAPQGITFYVTIGIGIISFIVMAITAFAALFKKIKAWAIVIVLVGLIVFGGGGILFAYNHFKNKTPTWTGQDLFAEVNIHRREVGVPELVLSEGLCDNLVSRWQMVKDGKEHQGFEDWVKNEGIQTNYGYKQVAELYIISDTANGAIKFWSSSPGHKLELENPKWTDGCTYANDGVGVLELSTKKE